MISLDEYIKVLPSTIEIDKVYIVQGTTYQGKELQDINPRLYDVISSSINANDEMVVYVR